jgi:hypothetical protein
MRPITSLSAWTRLLIPEIRRAVALAGVAEERHDRGGAVRLRLETRDVDVGS